LIKAGKRSNQEPYNEFIATFLHEKLLEADHFVPYHLAQSEGLPVSICPNMLADDEELIPAFYVVRTLPQQNNKTAEIEHFLICCKKLGINDAPQKLSEMIVCDYLIANSDRHQRNFGIVRNVDTLECHMAPLFDSGSSLWAEEETLSPWTKAYHSKPFDSVPERQLALAREWEWFDSSQLDTFVEFLATTLSEGPFIHNRIRAALIQDYVEENIRTASMFRDGYRDHPALI